MAMDIGKVGAFCFLDAMTAGDSAAFCRRIERLGYKVLWTPEAWGREPFAHGGYLLAKTDTIVRSQWRNPGNRRRGRRA
jgi:hypothetical protein